MPRKREPELETVDFEGVDVLAVGGPYYGTGSPPDGDYYTDADLEQIAENTRRLMAAGELRAPLKLGHSIDQKLAKESGYSDGEMPALGWLDNPRVDSGKLLVDLRRVPKKLGSLFGSGAFRTRSVELKGYVSQKTGEKLGPAIKGLALQGAKAPAVRTLDDIIALYSEEVDEEEVQTREYGEMIWNPALGYRWVQHSISQALNPTEGNTRYFVEDVGATSALVSSATQTWVVPFAITDDKTTVAPAGDWYFAQPRWVEKAREYAEASGESVSRGAADTRGKMGFTLTDEKTVELAEKHGLDPEAEDFAAQLEAKLFEEEPPKPDDEGDGDEGEKIEVSKAGLEELAAKAEAGARAERQLAEMERDHLLDEAERAGKVNPAQREDWERRYDEQPEYTREVIGALEANPIYLREFGSDSDGRDMADEAEEATAKQYLAALGIESRSDS